MLALQGQVAAVVDHLPERGAEEERQERARRDQHDERVQGHLPQHEAPVVGKHVVHDEAQPLGRAETFVDEAHGVGERIPLVGAAHGAVHLLSPHHDGPTGPDSGPAARRMPLASMPSGSCGSGRPAGPNSTLAPRRTSNVE